MKSAFCILLAVGPMAMAQPTPLDHAHAHNDFEHARPLFDAVERGFGSVEADVYLVGGQLLVGHSRDSLDASRTLESLYLDPLRAYARQHGGRVHGGAQPLTLLIDVKTNADSTYLVLNGVLRRYADLFTIYAGSEVIDGPIVAVISGNRAIKTMNAARVRFAGADGRIPDLTSTPRISSKVMPLISDSWERITTWDGTSSAPATLRQEIDRLVSLAHQHGQRLRFWATPDNEAVWQLLTDAHVDLIGADDLEGLRLFLTRRTRGG
ncbi:MAG: hypothetical protein JWM95_5350 [Gemmatimonadetes bacterium]|nr:hypothetical protein [Gemmatimonadota bacterium]